MENNPTDERSRALNFLARSNDAFQEIQIRLEDNRHELEAEIFFNSLLVANLNNLYKIVIFGGKLLGVTVSAIRLRSLKHLEFQFTEVAESVSSQLSVALPNLDRIEYRHCNFRNTNDHLNNYNIKVKFPESAINTMCFSVDDDYDNIDEYEYFQPVLIIPIETLDR